MGLSSRYLPALGQGKAKFEQYEGTFNDQTTRYYDLSSERATNCWRIVFLLTAFILVGFFALLFSEPPAGAAHRLKCGINVMIEAVIIGCCCAIADQSFRHHENLRTNIDLGAAEKKGRPDFIAWAWNEYKGIPLMAYYLTSFLGLVLLAVSLWSA